MSAFKLLWGVCGIGNGHTQRQLPLLEHYAHTSRIVIFVYDSSFAFFANHFAKNPNVSVAEVAVPFYVGNATGLDLEATWALEKNKRDYDGINGRAHALAREILGTPDLVVSDYEPESAKYAHTHSVPLVTIDQQSKYLTGEFPAELNGQTYIDEVARLKMFFPTASARIACSFFDVVKKVGGEEVNMFPPILKDSILNMQNIPSLKTSILVYFSSQQEFHQSLAEVSSICATQTGVEFHIFAPRVLRQTPDSNVSFYAHGDARFADILRVCSGIISTAGHTLLSEAMFLGIPVYAIPLPVYEQQMNAEIIAKHDFGIADRTLNPKSLGLFIEGLARFRNNIKQDKEVLLRGNGQELVTRFIEANFLRA